MFCNVSNTKKMTIFIMTIGVITFAFGLTGHILELARTGNEDKLFGMFTGFGASWIILVAVLSIRNKLIPEGKRKDEEINRKDERNIMIYQKAYTVTSLASTAMFAIMAFGFLWFGYQTASYVAVGAIYVQAIVLFASRYYFSKKI